LYNRLTFYFLKVKRDEDDEISSHSLKMKTLCFLWQPTLFS